MDRPSSDHADDKRRASSSNRELKRLAEFLEDERSSSGPPSLRSRRPSIVWVASGAAAVFAVVGGILCVASGPRKAEPQANLIATAAIADRVSAPEKIASAVAQTSKPVEVLPNESPVTQPTTIREAGALPAHETGPSVVKGPSTLAEPSDLTGATPGAAPASDRPSEPKQPTDSDRVAVAKRASETLPAFVTQPLAETKPSNSSEEPAERKEADPIKAGTPALFNGIDLTNWENAEGLWHVVNGTIVGSVPAGTKSFALIRTKEKYKDFDLKLRVRLKGGSGNSGVQFRSGIKDPHDPMLTGAQCAIRFKDGDKIYPAGSVVTNRAGKLEVAAPSAKSSRFFKEGDFNVVQIHCEGKNVIVKVNRITMVNKTLSSIPEDGVFAFVLDGREQPGEVAVKDIQFTDLSRAGSTSGVARSATGSDHLVKAEAMYVQSRETAKNNLLAQFESTIKKRKIASHGKHDPAAEIAALEQEKEAFKTHGRIPWSRAMRSAMAHYLKELEASQKKLEKAFDVEIEQAKKKHDNRAIPELQEAEIGMLAPHVMAIAESGDTKFHLRSDGILENSNEQGEESIRRWWIEPPGFGVLVVELPSKESPQSFVQKGIAIADDGKTMTGITPDGKERVWSFVEE